MRRKKIRDISDIINEKTGKMIIYLFVFLIILVFIFNLNRIGSFIMKDIPTNINNNMTNINMADIKNNIDLSYNKKQLKFNKNDLSLEVFIADTKEKRKKGLSGFASIKELEGMLFLFDKPGHYGFWMKDMKFPIDIIWIDENYTIVDITKNVSPETFPTSFKPSLPAKYVLEVNAGFSDKYGISIGDKVEFEI